MMSIRAFDLKSIVICLTAVASLVGCELGECPQVPPGPLGVAFRLAGTTGRERRTFRPGESFDIALSVTNRTPSRLTYSKGDGGPALRISIVQGDSIVVSSVDGYAFVHVVMGGYLDPGQSLCAQWRAPNTPARDPKIVLAPGLYEIRASLPYFHEIRVQQVVPISFLVVE